MSVRLGKLPARYDPRTIPLSAVLARRLLAVPPSWDADKGLHDIPDGSDGNDEYGDCVIAAQAKQLRRFERAEHGRWPNVTTKEIVTEYLRQTGGADSGLYLLDSLKVWRTRGWVGGGRLEKIAAFGSISIDNSTKAARTQTRFEFKAAMAGGLGIQLGFMLPIISLEQFDADKPWSVDGHSLTGKYAVGSAGGHAVYGLKYGPDQIWVSSWARRKQPAGWGFVSAYCDEAFWVIDSLDQAKYPMLDMAQLVDYLDIATS